ncbi:MAG: hypothetical protein AAF403_03425, partial [Pseudomonadota bacterium]
MVFSGCQGISQRAQQNKQNEEKASALQYKSERDLFIYQSQLELKPIETPIKMQLTDTHHAICLNETSSYAKRTQAYNIGTDIFEYHKSIIQMNVDDKIFKIKTSQKTPPYLYHSIHYKIHPDSTLEFEKVHALRTKDHVASDEDKQRLQKNSLV